MSKNKLLLTISILYEEIHQRKNFILKTINNANNTIFKNHLILIIIQKDKEQKDIDIEMFVNLPNTEIIYSYIKSISHARNIGIEYAIKNNFSHILLSDSMVIIDKSFFYAVTESIKMNIDLMRGNLIWNYNDIDKLPKQSLQKNNINIFKNSYIGIYLFQVKKLTKIRFNENIGPGSYTTIKAGEDVLFLYNYTKEHGYNFSPVSGYIYHPPREKDFSKHLKYAKGQGALYRYFLSQPIKPKKYYLFLFLFWVNSFIRILLFKKNSLNIFFDRIYGFFILKIK